MVTYTRVEGTARTDEETSTDGTTNGNHVQMARLHRLVEHEEWAAPGAALERFEVEPIAGHEVLLFTPFSAMLTGGRVDGGMRSAERLLVRRQYLLFVVVHGGQWTAMCWSKERRGGGKHTLGTGDGVL